MKLMDNYIFCKKRVIDHRTCDHIINIFEKEEVENGVQLSQFNYDGISPTLKELRFSFLKPLLIEHMYAYGKKHEFLLKCPYDWGPEEEFNIQRYQPGYAYIGEHMEHGLEDYNYKRCLAWMIYLNDIKKAGGTHWPQQKFTTKPRAGDLYIWPAAWTHSHHGIEAPNEIKYIMTGWCSWLSRKET